MSFAKTSSRGNYKMMEYIVCVFPDVASISVGWSTLIFWCSGLQITKDTELGSNETIKNPTPMEVPPRRRKRCSDLSDV